VAPAPIHALPVIPQTARFVVSMCLMARSPRQIMTHVHSPATAIITKTLPVQGVKSTASLTAAPPMRFVMSSTPPTAVPITAHVHSAVTLVM
jgi:hypothetical protein